MPKNILSRRLDKLSTMTADDGDPFFRGFIITKDDFDRTVGNFHAFHCWTDDKDSIWGDLQTCRRGFLALALQYSHRLAFDLAEFDLTDMELDVIQSPLTEYQ
ncbi:MAG: hypothetical protein KOO62_09190 [candidate division Zixibacteria bacterium]|nr:hypothetical protein [candidate division Zixibacteria bacterium]